MLVDFISYIPGRTNVYVQSVLIFSYLITIGHVTRRVPKRERTTRVNPVKQLQLPDEVPRHLQPRMSEECANPLLLGWIKEWLDQARERNSKGVTVSAFPCARSSSYAADAFSVTKRPMSR